MDILEIRELLKKRGLSISPTEKPKSNKDEAIFYVSNAGTVHEQGCRWWRPDNLKTETEISNMDNITKCGLCIPPL